MKSIEPHSNARNVLSLKVDAETVTIPGYKSSAVFLRHSTEHSGRPKLTPRALFPVIFIICSINFTTLFRHVKKQTWTKKNPEILKCRTLYAASIQSGTSVKPILGFLTDLSPSQCIFVLEDVVFLRSMCVCIYINNAHKAVKHSLLFVNWLLTSKFIIESPPFLK
jgi:hypothetical protein